MIRALLPNNRVVTVRLFNMPTVRYSLLGVDATLVVAECAVAFTFTEGLFSVPSRKKQ